MKKVWAWCTGQIQQLKPVKNITGVCLERGDNSEDVEGAVVYNSLWRGELSVDKVIHFSNQSELINLIKASENIVLVIVGKGVMTKFSASEDLGFEKVFNTLNLRDFDTQQLESSCRLRSVIRKEVLNELITCLNNLKIHPAGIFIDIACSLEVLRFIDSNSNHKFFDISGKRIEMVDSEIESFKSIGKVEHPLEYEVDSYSLKDHSLLAFSAVISFVNGNRNIISIENPIWISNLVTKKYTDLTTFWVRLLLVVIFLLLVGDYSVQEVFTNKNVQLNSELELFGFENRSVKEQKELVEKRQRVFQKINSNTLGKYSHVLNDIGLATNNGIELIELIINPSKKLKKKNEYSLDLGEITISGKGLNNQLISDFMSELMKLPWIKDGWLQGTLEETEGTVLFHIKLKF